MLRLIQYPALLVLSGLTLIGCGKRNSSIADADLARFVATRRTQAKELANAQTNPVPNAVWEFFAAVERDDWHRATNLFAGLQKERSFQAAANPSLLQRVIRKLGLSKRPNPALQTKIWSPISETFGAYAQFHEWDPKWLRRFARDVINLIPPDSIYFGGTDSGRFVISAFSASYRDGRPFFTLTQNQLADGTYLDYLRNMYGHKLYIPTAQDSQQAFQEYLVGAHRRLQEKKLKPGEDVRIDSNRVHVSGQVAVMQINGLLAKVIVDKNPERDFYVEEGFPLDWMYPHLSPHGLILKLHREPLAELDEPTVSRDRDYWSRYARELVGGWLSPETSLSEVCEFCRKVYLRKDIAGFGGDADFAHNEAAQKTFSKLRSAIGGVYAWRAGHANTPEEKNRMLLEAEFAFKQALALCPYSPEATYRYVNLLLAQKRVSDSRLIAQTLIELCPQDDTAKALREQVAQAEAPK